MCRTIQRRQSNPNTPLPPANERTRPLFPLGQIVATPGVLGHFVEHGIDPAYYLHQHQCGKWGIELSQEDRRANDRALIEATRLLSSYTVKGGVKVWVITEWDRSVTTLLFPQEY